MNCDINYYRTPLLSETYQRMNWVSATNQIYI